MWGAAPTPPGHDAPHDVLGPPDVGLSQSASESLGQGNPLPRGGREASTILTGTATPGCFCLTDWGGMYLESELSVTNGTDFPMGV